MTATHTGRLHFASASLEQPLAGLRDDDSQDTNAEDLPHTPFAIVADNPDEFTGGNGESFARLRA